jgi:bifunctional non-homologous end joining protein LigD
MLATLVDKPFDEEGWQYEIKWDGYRAVAYCKKEKWNSAHATINLLMKNFILYMRLKNPVIDAVLDGEVIVAGESGISHFGNLQNWRSEADGELKYYVFDILWLDGIH